uniref:MADF domain-containing protein n=1 Tax=Parastrongyloides trichosuri TaxID=131310 RepID=A0A0N4Z6Z2_PARTI
MTHNDSLESLGSTLSFIQNGSPSLLPVVEPSPTTSEDPLKGITKDMKLAIVELVKHAPCIWNYNNPEYRSTPAKRAAWNRLANQLKNDYPETPILHDPDMVKTVWKNLLDYWRVVDKRMIHKDSNAEPSWAYYEQMNFLKPVRGTELIKAKNSRRDAKALKRGRSNDATTPDQQQQPHTALFHQYMKGFEALQSQWTNFHPDIEVPQRPIITTTTSTSQSRVSTTTDKENDSIIELKRIKVDCESDGNTASDERADEETYRNFSVDYDELNIDDIAKYIAALEIRLQSVKRGDRKNYITCLKKVWDVVFEFELQTLSNQNHVIV